MDTIHALLNEIVVNNNSSCKKEEILKRILFGCRGCSAPKGRH